MKKNENLYIDIHVVQTVPPSCVNRDDTGSPKTCIYGGVRRARVSSQSWKHAVRVSFRDMYAPEDLGNRTKRIVSMVEDCLHSIDENLDTKALAVQALTGAGLKINSNDIDKGTDALFFMSHAQAKALAELTVAFEQNKDNSDSKDKIKEKKDAYKIACKEALKQNPSIDMALFGRMVASDPSLNYDAAVMVAHSISTHKVQAEYDYFTAVDDCSPEETSGAGHLGTVEFNSSTLYRYASINVRELEENLKEMTVKGVCNFVEAFLLSMPTGKLTTFGNRTLPNFVYVTARKDQPVNLVSAFEKPIHVDEDGGYVNNSIAALDDYAKMVYDSFVSEPVKAWVIGKSVDGLGEKTNLQMMLKEIGVFLDERISEVE